MQNQIPRLDFSGFHSDPKGFAQELGEAYQIYGFVELYNHSVSAELVDHAFRVIKAFFELPTDTKKKYHVKGIGGARGYTPFGIEKAKDQTVSDQKEFWHVGREVPRDHEWAENLLPNVWPEEIPNFKEYTWGMYQALESFGDEILRAFSIYLGLEIDYFSKRIDIGNSILRPLHYPPVQEDGSVRAAAHEDINLITLLVDAEKPGLQVLAKDGEWIPAKSRDGGIIVNIGDMMQMLTNHLFPSTTHRVVNPVGPDALVSRYSVPFFLHPNPGVDLTPLAQCITEDNPNRYPDGGMTADEYLQQRLREIGLK